MTMTLHKLWLGLLLLPAISPGTHAAALEDFEGSPKWRASRAEERGGAFNIVPSAQSGGWAGELSWAVQHAPFLEVQPESPIPLPMLGNAQALLAGEASVRIYSDGAAEPSRFAIRLLDAKGEVFQWSQSVDLSKQGWQTLHFDLQPENFRGSWGGRSGGTGQIQMPVRMHSLALTFYRNEPAQADAALRRILIDDLTVTGRAQAKASANAMPHDISASLHTGSPFSLIDPASPTQPVLILRNTSDKAFTGELLLTGTSYSGQSLQQNSAVKIAAGQELPYPVELPLDQQDYWDLHYQLKNDNGQSSGRQRLGVMQPAGPAPAIAADGSQEGGKPPFLLGVCTDSQHRPLNEVELEARAAGLLGMRVVRGGASWGQLQPNADTWRFEIMDRLVHLYGAQGIRYQYILAYTPRWASSAAPEETNFRIWSRMPPHPAAWERYVRTMAERYHAQIHDWEVWNEPDSAFFRGTVEEYLGMLRQAHTQIKEVSPDLRVLTGGFTHTRRNLPFVKTVLQEGGDYYDILAWHAHGGFSGFQVEVDGPFQALREQFAPDKPVYFNETGLTATGDDRRIERLQAEAVVKKIALSWARGAVGYSWYNLRDSGLDPNNAEHRYGLLTHGFQPKPSYMAFNAFSALLGEASFIEAFDLGRDAYVLLFQAPDGYVLLTWAEAGRATSQIMIEASAGGTASLRDIMGNETEATALPGGRHIAPINREPQFWVLRGENLSKPRLAGRLIEIANLPVLVPGAQRPLELRINNPLPTPEEVTVQITLPASLGSGVLEKSASLPAGGQQTFQIQIPLPTDISLPGTVEAIGHIHYHSGNGLLQGELPLQLRTAHPLQKPDQQRAADFVLDRRLSVFNFFDADPNSEHHQWGGPDDLSAKVWISADDNALILRVDVKDNIHHQPYGIQELWRGDSLQVAMQVDGQAGLWEISLARGMDGQPLIGTHLRPHGKADPRESIILDTEQLSDGVRYDVRLPFDAFDISPEDLQSGLALSLLVNDNDGEVRKGWIELTPGIGQDKDPLRYLRFVRVQAGSPGDGAP